MKDGTNRDERDIPGLIVTTKPGWVNCLIKVLTIIHDLMWQYSTGFNGNRFYHLKNYK